MSVKGWGYPVVLPHRLKLGEGIHYVLPRLNGSLDYEGERDRLRLGEDNLSIVLEKAVNPRGAQGHLFAYPFDKFCRITYYRCCKELLHKKLWCCIFLFVQINAYVRNTNVDERTLILKDWSTSPTLGKCKDRIVQCNVINQWRHGYLIKLAPTLLPAHVYCISMFSLTVFSIYFWNNVFRKMVDTNFIKTIVTD